MRTKWQRLNERWTGPAAEQAICDDEKEMDRIRTHTAHGRWGEPLGPARVGGDTLDCQSRPMMEWRASSQKKRNQDANEDANEGDK